MRRIVQLHFSIRLLVLFAVQITSFHPHIFSHKVSFLRQRSQQIYSSDTWNAPTDGVILGTFSTIFIIKRTPFQHIASPIVGVLTAVVYPSIAASAYCGSFIGIHIISLLYEGRGENGVVRLICSHEYANIDCSRDSVVVNLALLHLSE
eukprot:gene29507-38610_t